MPCTPDIFCKELVRLIKARLFDSGYSVKIGYECNYNHTAWSHPEGSTGSAGGSEGGGGGNSSSSGNSSSTSPSSFDEPVADTNRVCKRIQYRTEKLWKSLDSIQATTLGTNTYIFFQTYLDEVAKDPRNEHATLLIDYEDEENTRVLTEVFHGSKDEVTQTFASNYVVAQIHNHPNASPPSAQDLLFTAEMMRDKHNYQTTFIYNYRNESYYSLYVYNPRVGMELSRGLENEIDSETHDFKSGGKCEQILNNHTYVYQKFSREMKQTYRLCIIIEEYGRGIVVTKYNPKTKRNEVYRVKKGNEIYTPLIYK